MAEINIERKDRGPWMWIIGLLALLLIWLLYSMFDRDDDVAEVPIATEPMATMPVVDPAAVTPRRLLMWTSGQRFRWPQL